ncbi:hypothetical protein COB55_03265 [Candidatus Wolfebacteria bacterium]|nr:MAG: hypothetical protein COB55_03265 [Candidatus Wolfebacteria bacterium]
MENEEPPKIIDDAETTNKKMFAMLIAKKQDPFFAAIEVLGSRTKASDIYLKWMEDPLVIECKKEFIRIEEGIQEEAGVASSGDKEFDDFNAELLAIFRSHGNLMDDRLKAGKMYAEINGYIKKAEPITNVQINHHQSPVMIVHRNGDTDEDYENKLATHSKKLMDGSLDDIEVEIEDVG